MRWTLLNILLLFSLQAFYTTDTPIMDYPGYAIEMVLYIEVNSAPWDHGLIFP